MLSGFFYPESVPTTRDCVSHSTLADYFHAVLAWFCRPVMDAGGRYPDINVFTRLMVAVRSGCFSLWCWPWLDVYVLLWLRLQASWPLPRFAVIVTLMSCLEA